MLCSGLGTLVHALFSHFWSCSFLGTLAHALFMLGDTCSCFVHDWGHLFMLCSCFCILSPVAILKSSNDEQNLDDKTDDERSSSEASDNLLADIKPETDDKNSNVEDNVSLSD